MGYLDFTTLTETDPNNRLTVDTNILTVASVNGTDGETKLVKDYGSGYWSDSWEFAMKVNATTLANNSLTAFCCLSDADDSIYDMYFGDSGNCQFVGFRDNSQYIVLREHNGNSGAEDSFVCSLGTDYWIRFIRDDTVSSYGILRVYIYSDEDMTTLEDTLSLTLTESKKDFQFLFPFNLWNNGTSASQSYTLEDLNLQEDVSPYEDFRTYTNSDTNNRFDVFATSIRATGLSRADQDHYVAKDFGVGYFGAAWEQHMEFNQSCNDTRSNLVFCCLTNDLNDPGTIDINGGSCVQARTYDRSASYVRPQIIEVHNGTLYADQADDSTFTENTTYYSKFYRDDARTFGTIYLAIYDDKDMTSLVQTFSLALHANHIFRYRLAASSNYDNTALQIVNATTSKHLIVSTGTIIPPSIPPQSFTYGSINNAISKTKHWHSY